MAAFIPHFLLTRLEFITHDITPPGMMDSGEYSALEAIVHALPALPPRVRELQRSVAVLVGGLAPWLARWPRCLEPALNAVLGALGLEEDGVSKSEVSMREKGEDHVRPCLFVVFFGGAVPELKKKRPWLGFVMKVFFCVCDVCARKLFLL